MRVVIQSLTFQRAQKFQRAEYIDLRPDEYVKLGSFANRQPIRLPYDFDKISTILTIPPFWGVTTTRRGS
jgi:hypothetical protein